MRTWVVAIAIAAACGSFIASAAAPAETEKLVAGNWTCVGGPCMAEEMGFLHEDGERTYRSWTHHRPSDIASTWKLEADRLTVTRDGQVSYDWRVVKVDARRMVLRGANGDLVLKRIVEKEAPPKK